MDDREWLRHLRGLAAQEDQTRREYERVRTELVDGALAAVAAGVPKGMIARAVGVANGSVVNNWVTRYGNREPGSPIERRRGKDRRAGDRRLRG